MGTASRLIASASAVALLVLLMPLLGWAGRGDLMAPLRPFWDVVLVAATLLIPGLLMRSFGAGSSAALLGVTAGYIVSALAFGSFAPDEGLLVGLLGSAGVSVPISSLALLLASAALAGLVSHALGPRAVALPEEVAGPEEQPVEEAGPVTERAEMVEEVKEPTKPESPQPEPGESPQVQEQVGAAPAEVEVKTPTEKEVTAVSEEVQEEEEEVLTVCLNCRKEVPAKAAYCPYCGSKL
ncbi:MAG: zinc ribbon domain-containing protein [Nitrososphaerota archaeon]|nr:zinc ribbon domain-containing protein [Candidatus Calditenuis fumarioli]